MDAQINVEVYPIGPYNELDSFRARSHLASEETTNDDDTKLTADALQLVDMAPGSIRGSRSTSLTE